MSAQTIRNAIRKLNPALAKHKVVENGFIAQIEQNASHMGIVNGKPVTEKDEAMAVSQFAAQILALRLPHGDEVSPG